MYDCVIKTARDCSNNIQWQGLYVDGKKVIENFEIDLNKALPIFAPDRECMEVDILEDEFEVIAEVFPSEEDFSYLMDYQDIHLGDTVYLEDGPHEVLEITSGYRESGQYSITDWVDEGYYQNEVWIKKFVPYTNTTFYTAHTITIFKVKDKKRNFVWEDYNYQQSYLFDNYKNKKRN